MRKRSPLYAPKAYSIPSLNAIPTMHLFKSVEFSGTFSLKQSIKK
ncbi:hypothetical protein APHWI1_0336 [Anaplasma phagocytophilum str. ApWI1]|uniref:Uncharacterized protein n=1 Tax=Anaplasma phagocytophilum str. ApWI1 TaxID=1359155 RepID=A0A0F3Q0H7_ANAPH|nr:hypothetical protein APHWI1_0336 [Anaplasma phagocytophilum str. ApWI1]KJZ99011.1 hypothetical protein APHCR_0338 [Anaplasma phagocytophilum str. CR1007]